MSVEMLEHVRNYRELFARMSGWLAPGGRAFVHVFSHCRFAYTFSADDPHDWMGSRFFSGGQMPAHDLFLQFGDDLVTVDRWWVGGEHYARTLEAWLRLYDDRADALAPILAATYGAEAAAGMAGRLAALPARLRRDVRLRRRAPMGRVALPAGAGIRGPAAGGRDRRRRRAGGRA